MIETIDICTSRHIDFLNSVNKSKKDKIDKYLASSGRRLSLDSYADLCRFVDDKKIEYSVNSFGNSGICTKSDFMNKDKFFLYVVNSSGQFSGKCTSLSVISQRFTGQCCSSNPLRSMFFIIPPSFPIHVFTHQACKCQRVR